MPRLCPHGVMLLACLLVSCGGGDSDGSEPPPQQGEFNDPQRVTILGYNDHAMEPSISRDGQYLFFNNSNDPSVNTNLHWATRVNDLTFQYQGEIGGVNTSALDGVASMDRNNVFYFISTRSYNQTLSTVYRGTFANGTLSGIELVPGISPLTTEMVNFDAEISPDGNTLYFVDSQFSAAGTPLTADIVIAERNGPGFSRASNSAAILQQINTGNMLEYAPAISASGLELFFTRLEGNDAAIYTATRGEPSSPFGPPKKIQAITGVVEGPTLAPDEKSLYYHKRENNLFVIYRVTRP
jgi:Tol biopolymer transport system component